MRNYRYDADPLLGESGISIEKQLTQVEGRVLETPKVGLTNIEVCVCTGACGREKDR